MITWNNQAYSKPFSVVLTCETSETSVPLAAEMAVEGEIFHRKPTENLSVTFSFLNSL